MRELERNICYQLTEENKRKEMEKKMRSNFNYFKY